MTDKVSLVNHDKRYANITNHEAQEVIEESLKHLDAYGMKVSVEDMDKNIPVIRIFWQDGPSVESVRNLLPEWARLPTTQFWRLFSKEGVSRIASILIACGADPKNLVIDNVNIEFSNGTVTGNTVNIINGSLGDLGTRNFVVEKTPLYKH